MTVGELVTCLSGVVAPAAGLGSDVRGREVSAIAYDSRRVTAGAIFVAVSGQRFDGAEFAADAVTRGAVLVVSASPSPAGGRAAWVVVADARLALAELAAAFYHDPSHDLIVVGVTGTNGKTTTTYLLAAIFDAAGWASGRIGSVTYDTGGMTQDAERTTPEAPEVQALLREMVQHERATCAMEVSSHALAMRRVEGTRFAAAVFSNLTRDHLDYHSDMGHYFGTKRRLFEMLPAGAPAIINTDDSFGRQLVEVVGRPLTYAIDRAADVTPERVDMGVPEHVLKPIRAALFDVPRTGTARGHGLARWRVACKTGTAQRVMPGNRRTYNGWLAGFVPEQNGRPSIDITFGKPETIAAFPAQKFAQRSNSSEVKFAADDPAQLELARGRWGHLFVKPIINGKRTGWFAIDTGANGISIDYSQVEQLGLTVIGDTRSIGLGGESKTTLVHDEAFKVGPMEIRSVPLAASDMSGISLGLNEPVMGLLGMSVLSHCVLEYDVANTRVALHDPEKYELSGGKWMPMMAYLNKPTVRMAYSDYSKGQLPELSRFMKPHSPEA